MTVFGQDAHAFAHLALQAGDAHHVEFIEIVGRDRQEAQALKQRMARIFGLFDDALVEGQPRQFAVDVKGAAQAFQGIEIDDFRHRLRQPGLRLSQGVFRLVGSVFNGADGGRIGHGRFSSIGKWSG